MKIHILKICTYIFGLMVSCASPAWVVLVNQGEKAIIEHQGKQVPAKPGTHLAPGDTLLTHESRVKLGFGTSIIRLAENTSFRWKTTSATSSDTLTPKKKNSPSKV
ncbi:MAG TPA: hypothetical protein PLU50_05050 [Pseudobdellovibrionaceae bacterium]|nr:hypothetical protein [Pseudobdellovibrionaceae bacterium]